MADRDHELDLAWQLRIGIWVAQGVLCAYGIGIGFAALSNPAIFPPGIGYDFVLQVPDLAARAFGALLVVLGMAFPSHPRCGCGPCWRRSRRSASG